MRVAKFGDIFYVPQWRLCAVQDCLEVVRQPKWFCERHGRMAFAAGDWGQQPQEGK